MALSLTSKNFQMSTTNRKEISMFSWFPELSRAGKVVFWTVVVAGSILVWCVHQTSGSIANSVGNTIVNSVAEKNILINQDSK